MNRISGTMGAIGILAAAFIGCGGGGSGGSPLDGTWTYNQSTDGQTVTIAITLSGGGGLSETLSDGACTGSLTISGQEWTSTLTTISVTGTGTCSGTLTCDGISLPCSKFSGASAGISSGAANYALSNGNNTLKVTTSNGTLTFTRE
jgi:hypothetical protein